MTVPASPSLAFTIWGPIAREDLPGLCDRVCALFGAGEPGVAVCDVRGVPADAVTVDALARLQVGARRNGMTVLLRGASPALLSLVGLMGLTDVLPECPVSDSGCRGAREHRH